ncbi:MAG TPA: hypothetical protein VF977_08520 [Candidatus Binatia bacterium]
MPVTRLISIPALVIDLMMLAQVMAAGAGYLIRAADERSARDVVPGSADSKAKSGELKITSEKTAAVPPATQEPATDKRAAGSEVSESRAPRKPNASTGQSQEQKILAEKSLLQMLEGRETELTVTVAIALVFFFIGWICGGNYYLRRDRRRRAKLQF